MITKAEKAQKMGRLVQRLIELSIRVTDSPIWSSRADGDKDLEMIRFAEELGRLGERFKEVGHTPEVSNVISDALKTPLSPEEETE